MSDETISVYNLVNHGFDKAKTKIDLQLITERKKNLLMQWYDEG